MHKYILREIMSLTSSDCFTIFSRVKSEFDFPLHSHEELELNFIKNAPYGKGDRVYEPDISKITLTEVSKLAKKTDVSFSRIFKAKTGISFMDSLLEMRLGHASRLLIDTTQSVAEVAYNYGFNNISNLIASLKRKKVALLKNSGRITVMAAVSFWSYA